MHRAAVLALTWLVAHALVDLVLVVVHLALWPDQSHQKDQAGASTISAAYSWKS